MVSRQTYKHWGLILVIPRALCTSSVEAFRASFHNLRTSVDDELKLVGFLSKEMAGKHMMDKGFHYNQVLSKAEDRYRSLLHNQEWHSEAYKITKQIIRALFL